MLSAALFTKTYTIINEIINDQREFHGKIFVEKLLYFIIVAIVMFMMLFYAHDHVNTLNNK